MRTCMHVYIQYNIYNIDCRTSECVQNIIQMAIKLPKNKNVSNFAKNKNKDKFKQLFKYIMSLLNIIFRV